MPQRPTRSTDRSQSNSHPAMRKRFQSLERKTEGLLREIKLAVRQLSAGHAAPMAGLRLRPQVRRRTTR